MIQKIGVGIIFTIIAVVIATFTIVSWVRSEKQFDNSMRELDQRIEQLERSAR